MMKMSTRSIATGATPLHAEWKGYIHTSKLHLKKNPQNTGKFARLKSVIHMTSQFSVERYTTTAADIQRVLAERSGGRFLPSGNTSVTVLCKTLALGFVFLSC